MIMKEASVSNHEADLYGFTELNIMDDNKQSENTHPIDNTENLTADKLLDELSLQPSQPEKTDTLYMTMDNNSRTNYDQFFEEVSLDLPRDLHEESRTSPSKLLKFMPRRANSSAAQNNYSVNLNKHNTSHKQNPTHYRNEDTLSSDIAGPFYTISDVLNDANSSTMSTTNKGHNISNRRSEEAAGIGSRGARRNVNEPEIVVTSGGTSIHQLKRRSSLNPFKRTKSINNKPTPLESVISKTRPRMLPPKNPQEEKKHLQQYEKMMKKAKKLEEKKQKEVTRKKEEKDKKISHAMYTWENEIIPEWNIKATDKKTVSLWNQGIPPRCRRRVWNLKIGNQLDIGKNTFNECLKRIPQSVRTSKSTIHNTPTHHYDTDTVRVRRTSSLDVLQDKETDDDLSVHSLEASPYSSESETRKTYSQSEEGDSDCNGDRQSSQQEEEDSEESETDEEEGDELIKDPMIINFLNKAIDEDILRTLPSLCVFQPDGPLFISLRKVLHAYVGYRPNRIYSRGTSFLAGVLLLNMNPQEAFRSLVNLIDGSSILSALYHSDERKIQGFFKVFNVIFAENLPKLYLHFKNLTLTPDNYLPDWFMTLFASIIPLELSSRLWDIYLLHGDIILFRTGLVVLKYLEPLLWGGGFSETVKILNMGFIGENRGEEVKAALAVSGHITEGDEDPFFNEILGRKSVLLEETRYRELLKTHLPS